jgi:hypothetical protein
LFVSRGRTVRLTTVSDLPLREALRELIELGDARLVYYAPDGSVYQVEVSKRGRAGCVAQLRGGRVLYTTQCLRELAKYLDTQEGVVELIELDAARVRTDLLSLPQSILPMGVRDVEALTGGAAGGGEEKPAAAPAAPPEAPTPAPVALAAAPGTVQQVLQQHLTLLARRGMRLSDTFNVLAAGVVAVAGKEVAAQDAARPCLDIVADIAMLRGRALIDCRSRDERIIVLLDSARGKMEALYTHGDATYTGLPAMERAAQLRPSEVRVFLKEQ